MKQVCLLEMTTSVIMNVDCATVKSSLFFFFFFFKAASALLVVYHHSSKMETAQAWKFQSFILYFHSF